jgi:hypothetical protein
VGAITLAGLAFYNYRVTGGIFQLPYGLHEKTYSVSPLFIWEELPPTPGYRHDIIREFHASFELPVYLEKRSFRGFISRNFAALMFFLFFGWGIFAIPLFGAFRSLVPWVWRNRWGRIALSVYVVFATGIMVAIHNRLHYWAPITALNYFFVIQGIRLWRFRDRRVGQLVPFLVSAMAATLLAILVYRSIGSTDDLSPNRQRARLLRQLNASKEKHLIVVKYGPHHSYQNDWIFNGANIDASKVVWAREMEMPQNCKLINYFKDRVIWLLEIDRDEDPVKLRPYPKESCLSANAGT